MPLRPKKPCNAQGCNVLTRNPRYCDDHADIGKSAEARRRERQRETSAQRGYSYKWQQARKAYLAKHSICAECERQGLVVAATNLDHIVPHKGDKSVFWDSSNWQAGALDVSVQLNAYLVALYNPKEPDAGKEKPAAA